MNLSKFKSKTFSRRGVSLLEVVVATGIIAVGVAITLPAVGTIRDSSLSLTCKDHMRTIGQAQLGYSLDHMGRFPGNITLHSQPAWAQITWVHLLNHEYFGDEFIGGSDSYFSFYRMNSGTIRWVGSDSIDGQQHKNQIWCPSLRHTPSEYFRCYPMNSYAAAGSYTRDDGMWVIGHDDYSSKYNTYWLGVKTSQFKNPAISVLHHEGLLANDWITAGNDLPLLLIESIQDRIPGAANTTGLPTPGSSSIPWHFRHNYRMNMLFVDGHVATETFASEGLNSAERYRYDN